MRSIDFAIVGAVLAAGVFGVLWQRHIDEAWCAKTFAGGPLGFNVEGQLLGYVDDGTFLHRPGTVMSVPVHENGAWRTRICRFHVLTGGKMQ